MSRVVSGRTRWLRIGYLAVALAAPAGRLRAQLAVDRIDLVLRRSPDGSARGTFHVRNESDTPLQARVYLADWDRGVDGENRFFEYGSHPHSCAPRMEASPAGIRLEPRMEQTISVTLRNVPDTASACWGLVFVEASSLSSSQNMTALQYSLRAGVKIYSEVLTPRRRLLIRDMAAQTSDAAVPESGPSVAAAPKRSLLAVVDNSGTSHVLARGRLELRGPRDSLAAAVPIEEFPMLAGARRLLRLPIPSLPPGEYVAVVFLDYDGEEVAVGQLPWSVP